MQTAELAILDWIQETFRCGFLDALMPAVSGLCAHGEIWILLAAILICVRRTRKTGAGMLLALAVDYLACNLTIKPLVDRIRPYAVNTAAQLIVPMLEDASFPSGHTAACFAATAVLWKMKSPLFGPALALSVLIAFSRLYLYVHWPTDVLCGAALGWVCGLLAVRILDLVRKRFLRE